ncbi:hypothetical protein CXIVA_25540 [Clostridium sp. SY8519]|nr:hypothetical protein CXIVA_25540 [Clostridium sp. SY8519]
MRVEVGKMIDFHSHILPGIDDGSKDLDESLQLLLQEHHAGVDTVVFTPHFYADSDRLEPYCRRREESFQQLKQAAGSHEELKSMEFRLGAEAAYFPGMGEAEGLQELCISGTDILLVELPFQQWDPQVVRDIRFLIKKQKRSVMLAHVERYVSFQKDRSYWEELFQLPVIAQMNAGCFLHGRMQTRKNLKLMAACRQVVLGTDTHNTSTRVPNLAEGRRVIAGKFGEEFLRRMDACGAQLLQGRCGT